MGIETPRIVRNPPAEAVTKLLASAELPATDITPGSLEHFFGMWEGTTLVGVVGMEVLGAIALLRSLAVATFRHNGGFGARLLEQAEQHARDKGVHTVFLLTTTAESYFKKHGYSPVSREAAPSAIRNTREFTGLCPSSAVLMVKYMSGGSAPRLAPREG